MVKQSGEYGRLRWKCRRGMLELDMILLPFLDRHYDQLTLKQKHCFEILLEEQDPILHAWFMRQTIPEDKEIAAMIDCICMALQNDKGN